MDDLILTSPSSVLYNCIAWAANDTNLWWWPDSISYWPTNVPRIQTVDAFIQAFGTLGYEPCDNEQLEPECEKVAIFVDENGEPTHAARQLYNGKWTSKLGQNVDVEHELYCKSVNRLYGRVGIILKRPRDSKRI